MQKHYGPFPKQNYKIVRYDDLGVLAAVAVGIVADDPPWAQVLPQPPPAAKTTEEMIRRADQRTVMASGQLGATIINA